MHRKRSEIEPTRTLSLDLLEHEAPRQYHGLAEGNLCWVAWKGGRREDAEVHGRAALESWELTPFSFQWIARLPLIAVLLHQKRIADAVDISRFLLDDSQEELPRSLRRGLEQAVASSQGVGAKTVKTTAAAEELLQRSVREACVHGYL